MFSICDLVKDLNHGLTARQLSTTRRIRSDMVMPRRLASTRNASCCGLVRVIEVRSVVAIRTTLASWIAVGQGFCLTP